MSSPVNGLVARARRLPAVAARACLLVARAAPGTFTVAVLSQVVAGVGVVVQMLLVRAVITELADAQSSGSTGRLLPLLAIAVGVTALVAIIDQWRGDQQRVLGEAASVRASASILDVVTSVPLVRFDEPDFHDRLMRAQVDVLSRPVQISFGLLTIASSGVALVGVLAVLFVLNPLFVILVVLAACPLVVAMTIASKRSYDVERSLTAADRQRQYLFFLLAGRTSAAEVRAYGLRDDLGARHERLHRMRLDALRRLAGRRMLPTALGVIGSCVVLSVAVVLLAGTVAEGTLSLGSAVAAVGGLFLLSTRLPGLASAVASLVESSLFLDDVDLLLAEPRLDGGAGLASGPPPAAPGRLIVRDARFAYPAREDEAIRGVSIVVEPGEVVALVGENGSGKSTLVGLVSGLFEPAAGSVTWDGTDRRDIEAAAWSRRFAVVFQDHVRYNLAARDAIGLGDTSRPTDTERVWQVAEQAGIAGVLAGLPDGLETPLGPQFLGGTDLSGGQWQRLALARALYRDAPFVVLDEPTASLDPAAEAAWFASLRSLLHGRSALVVSHRFSTVRSADRIYVLHDGTVVEAGTHDQLMELDGRYAHLFRLQAATFALEVAS